LAAFLDISRAFNKVWHTGFLYKLRRSLPLNYFLILKSYLHSRHFLVKVETKYTELSSVNAGVPQGRVLGSLLYLLYTADLPTSPESTTATFANDTAVVTMDSDPSIASQKLQTDLLAIQNWFKKMENESQRIQVNPRNIHYTKRNVPTLTRDKHIFEKWKQLGITLTKMYWLLGHKSKLSTSNKLLIYRVRQT
jgi:hypothetical protein